MSGTVLLLLLSGCASTWIVGQNVQNGENGQLTYRQLQDRLQGKAVCVILKDHRRILGNISEIAPDSVRLCNDASTTFLAVPTLQVWYIEKTDHANGGILGLLGGAAGGLLLGGALGEMLTPRDSELRGVGVGLAAVGGAGLGALGGTIYGAVHGIINRYEFQADTLALGTP